MSVLLNVGDPIPSFSLKNQEGITINSENLMGNPFVFYFYPKDDTPGCTKEACSFRDSMERLNELDIQVIGVSPDSPVSHAKFISKYHLNFTLLSDENLDVACKFGAVRENQSEKEILSLVRSTFLINMNGIICWLEKPVAVEGHIERIIEAIHQLS